VGLDGTDQIGTTGKLSEQVIERSRTKTVDARRKGAQP
jgi:hypothetical protein